MKAIILALFTVIVLGQSAFCDNWPQWRGEHLNSLSTERALPDALSKENQVWRVELPGPGGASPIVWEDKLFLSTVDGDDLAILCYSTDGELLWKQRLDGQNQSIRMDNANSASPSPVTDGKHVWVMMTDGRVHCFTTGGKLVWKKNMQSEYGRFEIQFGMTSTPLLDKGVLYFQFIHGNMRDRAGSVGKIVALNAEDGSERWVHVRRTEATVENKHAYTSPTLYRNGDKAFLVVHGADVTTGHRLEDGEELWRIGGLNPKSSYNPFLRFVSSPVCSENLIVVPSAKSGPVIGLSPEVTGTESDDGEFVKWKLDKGTPDVATPVISNDLVYLARENGVFICLDAKTGEMLYEERVVRDRHRSTPVIADGRIYLIGRKGEAIVLAEGREFKMISEHQLKEDTTASPAIANGRIFVRTNKSLIAFEQQKVR